MLVLKNSIFFPKSCKLDGGNSAKIHIKNRLYLLKNFDILGIEKKLFNKLNIESADEQVCLYHLISVFLGKVKYGFYN